MAIPPALYIGQCAFAVCKFIYLLKSVQLIPQLKLLIPMVDGNSHQGVGNVRYRSHRFT